MTPSELKRLRELCEKATPGPWKKMAGAGWNILDMGGNRIVWCRSDDGHNGTLDDIHNAEFVAAARAAVPALLDEVERLEKVLAEALDERNELDHAQTAIELLRSVPPGVSFVIRNIPPLK